MARTQQHNSSVELFPAGGEVCACPGREWSALVVRPGQAAEVVDPPPVDPPPVDPPVNWCAELQAEIRKRQLVAGITDGWDSGDPADMRRLIGTVEQKADYTLDEFKAYVGFVRIWFVDAEWNGGAEAPAVLPVGYGGDAEDCEELLGLVEGMSRTRVAEEDWDHVDWSRQFGRGQGDDENFWRLEGLPVAHDRAAADYGTTWTDGEPTEFWRFTLQWRNQYRVVADMWNVTAKLAVAVLPGAPFGAQLRYWGRPEEYEEWGFSVGVDAQGLDLDLVEGQLGVLYEAAVAAAATSYESGYLVPTGAPPNWAEWPPDPVDPEIGMWPPPNYFGFMVDPAESVITLDWDFGA